MRNLIVAPALVLVMSLAPAYAWAPKRTAQQTLTGLVDQQGASYVLRSMDNRTDLAVLRVAQPDTLAKYVGTRVSVRGQMVSTAGTPVMNVRGITPLGPMPTGTSGMAERSAGEELNALSGIVARGPNGTWVLRDRETNNVLAVLQPAGVSGSEIAQYRNEKVLVEGELHAGSRATVLEVQRITRFAQ